ncbi:MAG TPA: MutS family DNA mismatch repair protein [Longimicrobiales bacterium]|nr:MutS family DNA mismatch repair protein [Longimicrobiales bacterium]
MTTSAERYSERRARFAADAEVHERRAWQISAARVAAFTAAVLCGLIVERTGAAWSVAGLVALMALFLVLVGAHQRARSRRAWFRELAALNVEGLHRLERTWDQLPSPAVSRPLDTHAYAADLDIYGHASLTQILGPVGSTAGAARLEEWLLQRSAAQDVMERQAAVRELAARLDVRDALAVHARRTRSTRAADVERFLSWAESAGWLRTHPVVHALSWLVPAATLSLLAAHGLGVIERALWLLPLALALALYFAIGGSTRAVFDEAFGREALFEHYPAMLELISATRFEAPLLRGLSGRLMHQDVPAHTRVATLASLMHHADMRHSSTHLPLFLLTLWDVHIMRALERWQSECGRSVRDWLDVLGTMEALCALATLHHDHPDWAFPVIDGAAQVIDAVQLGHPLLHEDVRVDNDVTVGPGGTFLLVTGSNMSGKSTLLRALGVNVVLAHAGAPVCARSMRLPPLEVHTSIRVQDSLARGVSYFMAELERLKQIVDAAERLRREESVSQLFLLDEILHGTNSAERRIAARHVIRHLVDTGALGAVTTHDLELADEPALRAAAQLVHFREQVTGASLSFDYLLRPGLATSTNALELMRLVGL